MNQNEKKIDLEQVMAFVRRRGFGLTLRGTVSFGFVLALAALYYAFAPRMESYRQEVAVTLDVREGQAVYPNDQPFSSADIVAAPVLNRVWVERKLSDRVKFEDFCKWFSFVGYDRERAKLDAEYQTKMSKRNITMTELSTLQSEYEAKLAASSANNRYVLSMKPTIIMSREEAVEIVQSVPKVWFEESSVLHAPQMPSVMRANVLLAYLKRMKTGDGRALELVDSLRLYRNEIAATCEYIRHKILRGRNVVVNGTNLGEYESRLDLIYSELLRLKNRLLSEGDPTDLEGFVSARMDDMACETMVAEEKAKAIRQTIDLLKDTAGREADGSVRSGSLADGAVTLQADASFFKDFTEMVRRSASQESVQKYADELSQYSKDLADIKARKLYYDQIGQYVAKTRARTGGRDSQAKLFGQVESFATEMLDVGANVMAFRDQALHIYRTADQFYALPSPVWYAKSFALSIPRLMLGLLALWALYNLTCLVSAWNAERKN